MQSSPYGFVAFLIVFMIYSIVEEKNPLPRLRVRLRRRRFKRAARRGFDVINR